MTSDFITADWLKRELQRADLELRHDCSPHQKWANVEKDDTRGGSLPEHLEAHEKSRNA